MYTILLHIIGYDIWFYLTHLLLHTPILQKIHKIHHSCPYDKMDWRDTSKAHVIENIIQPWGIIAPYLLHYFFPGTYFLQPTYTTLVVAFTIVLVRGWMRHDHRFVWLIGNHHLLHHKMPQTNYGEYWIDLLCCTRNPNLQEYKYGYIYT